MWWQQKNSYIAKFGPDLNGIEDWFPRRTWPELSLIKLENDYIKRIRIKL